jgi:hypothetical protein
MLPAALLKDRFEHPAGLISEAVRKFTLRHTFPSTNQIIDERGGGKYVHGREDYEEAAEDGGA